jgi:hypothetical protein
MRTIRRSWTERFKSEADELTGVKPPRWGGRLGRAFVKASRTSLTLTLKNYTIAIVDPSIKGWRTTSSTVYLLELYTQEN